MQCVFPPVIGCMTSTALNYNPEATAKGPCSLLIEGCMDTRAMSDTYCPKCTKHVQSECAYFGCTDSRLREYDSFATVHNGCHANGGCPNTVAMNYNPAANFDDGTCEIIGCADSTMWPYVPEANQPGNWCWPKVNTLRIPNSPPHTSP